MDILHEPDAMDNTLERLAAVVLANEDRGRRRVRWYIVRRFGKSNGRRLYRAWLVRRDGQGGAA